MKIFPPSFVDTDESGFVQPVKSAGGPLNPLG